jgi:hypothetical protein
VVLAEHVVEPAQRDRDPGAFGHRLRGEREHHRCRLLAVQCERRPHTGMPADDPADLAGRRIDDGAPLSIQHDPGQLERVRQRLRDRLKRRHRLEGDDRM